MAHNKQKSRSTRTPEPLRLVLDTNAHAAMNAHCSASPRNEVCGVLVGFTGEDAGGPWTRVVAVIEGKHAREDQMSVTFTHDTWDAVHTQLAMRKDKARVIGWYHTHPDFGIFFSAPDVFVQSSLFGLKGHVGFVVDPVRHECGVFVNTAKGLQTLARYEVARQNNSGHLVHCKYIDQPLREARDEARAAADSGDSYSRSSLDSIESSLARLERKVQINFWVVVAAVPILVLLGFAAGVLLGRQSGVLEIPRSVLPTERAQSTSRIPPVPAAKPAPALATPASPTANAPAESQPTKTESTSPDAVKPNGGTR